MNCKPAFTDENGHFIIDTMPSCVVTFGSDSEICDINPAGLQLLESSSKDLVIGHSLLPLVVPAHQAVVAELFKDTTRNELLPIEFELISMQGTRRWIEMRSTVLHKDQPSPFLAVLHDVTEKKKLEAQLRHAQKMDAIGTLSGGIAHDFNNILTAIIGYTNIVKLKLRPDDPARPFVDQILTSTERATGLTQSLLAFSRKMVATLKPHDLNEIAQRSGQLLHRLITEHIELKISPSADKAMTVADSGQLEQVLMNLITNARDAMPDGGTITISTGRCEIGNDFIRTHGYGKPGNYAVMTVADTGTGMEEAVRDRIFEPFFTTKEVGKGTGLGLSIVYGIIKQHNGYINCTSKPGAGTTFTIYLPLTKESTLQSDSHQTAVPRGGTEAILIAEDDHAVRKMTATFLKDFGYTVFEAEDGDAAVEQFLKQKTAISLLLFDAIMPKKDGKEAYDIITARSPGIKVLFMSGYQTNLIVKKNIIEAGHECILKPISPAILLNRVREVLDR